MRNYLRKVQDFSGPSLLYLQQLNLVQSWAISLMQIDYFNNNSSFIEVKKLCQYLLLTLKKKPPSDQKPVPNSTWQCAIKGSSCGSVPNIREQHQGVFRWEIGQDISQTLLVGNFNTEVCYSPPSSSAHLGMPTIAVLIGELCAD